MLFNEFAWYCLWKTVQEFVARIPFIEMNGTPMDQTKLS